MHRGVVAKGFAEVRKTVHIAGTEDEASAQLEGVFAEPVLPMSCCLRALARSCVVAAENMQEVGLAESGRAISFAVAVEERKGDPGLLAETARVVCVAQSDGGESGSALAESRFIFAQLRDVLSAEDSTVVA